MATTVGTSSLRVREAAAADLVTIRDIYDEGIEDRLATLDESPKSDADLRDWYALHGERYAVLIAEQDQKILGWASLNQYSHRCAYSGVADLSVYVARGARGTGVGTTLLQAIERQARTGRFHKIVLFALAQNVAGERLYRKMGYRDVGVFREQGRLDGRFVDVVAKEKLLRPLVLFVCKHNTGRSQMAEAFFRREVGDGAEVASAGTVAANSPDPTVVIAMAEVGIDIAAARPKLVDPAMVAAADRIITMGCDVEGLPRVDDDWGLPDPKGQPLERVREIRDLALEKARALATELDYSVARR